MNRFALTAIALALLAAGCNKEAPSAPAAAPAVQAAAVPEVLGSGIELANRDTAVRPQDDLFKNVNGKWLASFEIPADKSNYGSFAKLDDTAEAQLKAIIESLATQPATPPGSDAAKIKMLFASFMDEPALEALGTQPLAPTFAQIDALKTRQELPSLFAAFVRQGLPAPLYPYVHQDNKDATQYIGDFYQGGLGLPDRDYYLLNDAKFASIRSAYLKHIETMLGLAGIANAPKAAAAVMDLETSLAKGHWDKVKNRDPVLGYNKLTLAALKKLAPNLEWDSYIKAVGFDALPAVIVSQPSYLAALNKMLASTPLDTWKLYLKWQALHSRAPYLNKALVDENFAFFSKTLNGTPENRPRWKRGVTATETAMGEALGKIYVERHFPAANKVRMEGMVKNLMTAYGQSIETLSWMSDATKKTAKEKLAKIAVKIGYPNQWRDYAELDVKPGDLAGNMARAAAFEYQRNINKLGKPIDRNEWDMTPQTVNAYYSQEKNEIVFPAAILQPPFFNMAADDAVNYGGIGAVIGHEISHGFDDQGSQYDGDGNLRMWWTPEDLKKFQALGAKLAAQYDSYQPVKGYFVNGKYTLGENIADLGGLTISQKAYHLSLNGKDGAVLDGLTGDQRFFIGWAQVWSRKYRPENLLYRLKTDAHAPSEQRTNGTPVNIPGFYSAFGIQPTDKMYKPEAERITIW